MALVPLAEARARVLALVSPPATRRVRLAEAGGLVLAEDVRAPESVPPFASSAMDGYALEASEEAPPIRRRVARVILAGDPPGPALGAGEAVRIMTGAPLPEGADAVCMVEESEQDGDEVVLRHSPARGEHVRSPGEDVAAGEELMRAGTRLGPRHLGVLASTGIAEVLAFERPRVGVLSTGSELRPAPEPLAPGQIRDSNRLVLLALSAAAGADAVDLGLERDDEDAVAAAISSAGKACDLVVTSGGVSVGDKDVVKAVIDRCCPEHAVTMEVAIKPAKPLAFGRLAEGPLLVGLPGNPVSSAVAFELFVRPAIALLSGAAEPPIAPLRAVAAEPFSRPADGKCHVVHVSLSVGPGGTLQARRAGGHASHLLRSTMLADALALVADGDGVAEGSPVEVIPLSGFDPFALG